MWRNPEPVFDGFCPNIVNCLWVEGFQTKPFPASTNNFLEAHQILSDLYEALRVQPTKEAAEKLLRSEARRIAADLCGSKAWWLTLTLYGVVDLVEHDNFEAISAPYFFADSVAQLLHCLVGSEKQFLIGVRHGQAAWIDWAGPAAVKPEHPFLLSMGSTAQYIGREDLAMFDGAGKWSYREELPGLPELDGHLAKMADLLEQAYYNQQYAPHPDGSYVKLHGIPGLEGVTIKTKRGIRDRDYIDILALFVFSHGGRELVVIDGTEIMVEVPSGTNRTISLEFSKPRPGIRFLEWLAALIYHDLVTAKDVVPGRPRQISAKKAVVKQPENVEESLRWIYIPRKYRKQEQEVRRPVANPRSMAPHRVSGHKRVGNMTDAHRLAVEALEQETGIDILKWLPDGYTFVRPHIVPKDGSESLLKLPRFIKTRIQDDIKRLLVGPSPEQG